jgi:hypothetical protein
VIAVTEWNDVVMTDPLVGYRKALLNLNFDPLAGFRETLTNRKLNMVAEYQKAFAGRNLEALAGFRETLRVRPLPGDIGEVFALRTSIAASVTDVLEQLTAQSTLEIESDDVGTEGNGHGSSPAKSRVDTWAALTFMLLSTSELIVYLYVAHPALYRAAKDNLEFVATLLGILCAAVTLRDRL